MKSVREKRMMLLCLGAAILLLFGVACGGDEDSKKGQDAQPDIITSQDVTTVQEDGGTEVLDGTTDAGTDVSEITDVVDDGGPTPTTEELNQALEATESEGMAMMMVNLVSAFGESSTFLEEIETINPPPKPPNKLPECPVVEKVTGLDPKIVLKYVSTSRDENGNSIEVDGCTTQNGVFSTGRIEISRIGKLKDKYTRVQFENHVRGKRKRAPELNGCLKITKISKNVYEVSSDPDAGCALTVKLGKDINDKDIIFNTTICAAIRIEIDPLQNRLRISNADVRFSKGPVTCDKSSRSVTINTVDGQPSIIEYPYPLEGKTTCPISGSLRISGRYFWSDSEYAGLTYTTDNNGVGILSSIEYFANGKTSRIDVRNPINGLNDLQGISAMCLSDTERLYRCLIPADTGACEAIKGKYVAKAGKALIRYINGSNEIVASGPLGSDIPQDFCMMTSEADNDLHQEFSMTVVIAANCATAFFTGYGAPTSSNMPRPFGGCGELLITKKEQNKYSFDIVNTDGDIKLQTIFKPKSLSGSLDTTTNIMSINMTYDVPNDAGRKYCYSNSYIPNNPVLKGVTRERCLNHPLPPASIWASESQSALWSTLDTWGNTTELNTSCKTYTDQLAKDISNFDDIIDEQGNVITTGNDIEKGNPITEAYGKDLVSVFADPVSNDGTTSFYNPAPIPATIIDAQTKEVTINLEKDQTCNSDSQKCYEDFIKDLSADWDIQQAKFFDNTKISGKKFLFVIGRFKLKIPSYQDFKDACNAYVSGCDKLLSSNICEKISDPNCLKETEDLCNSLKTLCNKFAELEDPSARNMDNNNSIDEMPESWKTTLDLGRGDDGDPLNIRTVDLQSIAETIRGMVKQKQGLLGNNISRDFAFAYVDLAPDTTSEPYVTVSWNSKSANLQPASTTNQLDNILKPVVPKLGDKDLTTGKFYFTTSKASLNSVEYNVNTTYTFSLGSNYKDPVPANLSGSESILKIKSVPEINMCLPPPIILDNIYFPTIRWSPLIKGDGDLLQKILTDDKAQIDWSKFNETNGKELIKNLTELTKKMVTIYVGAYDRKDYRTQWPQARPLPQIYYHDELRDSIRVFPDIGFFTTTPMTWWNIAPAGRDYMQGHKQEIIDYLLDIAIIRADHKVFSAREIYGSGYPDAYANDVAVVVTMDIEWQPTIVINSDKLPGGNVTHFWRRDLVGLFVPSYNVCPQQQ